MDHPPSDSENAALVLKVEASPTNSSAPKKLIVVLGMHRSGTSAVTRGLQVLGVELGNTLLPEIANVNPKGFWEDMDISALNIEMLHAIGSDWHHLSIIRDDDVALLNKQGFLQRAIALLRQKAGDRPVFGFKDPRVSKLLAFWKGVFLALEWDVYYVFTLRNPLSVAKSLAKRDGFVPEESYLQWLGHVLVSLSETVGTNLLVLDYDRLMQAPEFELQRLASAFDLDVNKAELDIYLKTFLDPKLQHTRYGVNDLLVDPECPQLVADIFFTLTELAVEKSAPVNGDWQRKIQQWCAEFTQLRPSLPLVDTLYARVTHARQTVSDELRVEVNAINENANAQIAYREALVKEHEQQLVDEQHNAREQIAYREALVRDIEQQLADEKHNAQTQIAYRDALVRDIEQQLADEKSNAQAQIAYRENLAQELKQQLINVQRNAQAQITYRDTLVSELEQQLSDERNNAQAQIQYRDVLTEELQQQLADEKRNAEAQIHYRDALVEELRQQLADEKRNAEEQILYRNALIAELEKQLAKKKRFFIR